MIPIEYIILFSMSIVEVIKKRIPEGWSDFNPFIAFAIAIMCNVVNAALYGGDILAAGKDAFVAAGITLTMFSSATMVGKITKPTK